MADIKQIGIDTIKKDILIMIIEAIECLEYNWLNICLISKAFKEAAYASSIVSFFIKDCINRIKKVSENRTIKAKPRDDFRQKITHKYAILLQHPSSTNHSLEYFTNIFFTAHMRPILHIQTISNSFRELTKQCMLDLIQTYERMGKVANQIDAYYVLIISIKLQLATEFMDKIHLYIYTENQLKQLIEIAIEYRNPIHMAYLLKHTGFNNVKFIKEKLINLQMEDEEIMLTQYPLNRDASIECENALEEFIRHNKPRPNLAKVRKVLFLCREEKETIAS